MAFTSAGQSDSYGEFLLKDGSVIKGTVIDSDNTSATVVIMTGDTILVDYALLGLPDDTRLLQATTLSPKKTTAEKRKEAIKKAADRKQFVDGMIGFSTTDESGVDLRLLSGYYVRDHIGVGAEISYDQYDINFVTPDYLTLSPHVRYIFNRDKPAQWYAGLTTGVAFPSNNEDFAPDFVRSSDIGWYGRVEWGLRYMTSGSLFINASISLKYLSQSGTTQMRDFFLFDRIITQEYSKQYILPIINVGIGF